MAKVRSWAGLDVHAAKVVACVVDAESGEMTVHRLPGDTSEGGGVLRGAAGADAGGVRGGADRVRARSARCRRRGLSV